MYLFEAIGSEQGGDQFKLPNVQFLPYDNVSNAVRVEVTANGVRVRLLAKNVSAWLRPVNGVGETKLARGASVNLSVGDELVLCGPDAAVPPEEPGVVFLLCSQEDEETGVPQQAGALRERLALPPIFATPIPGQVSQSFLPGSFGFSNEPVTAYGMPGSAPFVKGEPIAAGTAGPVPVHVASAGTAVGTAPDASAACTAGQVAREPDGPQAEALERTAPTPVEPGLQDMTQQQHFAGSAANPVAGGTPAATAAAAGLGMHPQAAEVLDPVVEPDLAPSPDPAQSPGLPETAAPDQQNLNAMTLAEAAAMASALDGPSEVEQSDGPAQTDAAEDTAARPAALPIDTRNETAAAAAATVTAAAAAATAPTPPDGAPQQGASSALPAPAPHAHATPGPPPNAQPGGEPAGSRAREPARTPGPGDTVAAVQALLHGVQDALAPQHGGSGVSVTCVAGPRMQQLWTEELAKLRKRCGPHQTTIGVLGTTGAGKSSLLNAMLGEVDILPTNSMRASTACVVVLRHSPSSAYTADVHFMSEEAWFSAVAGYLEDLTDEDGRLRLSAGECNTRTEAGVAQATLEAVYGRSVVRAPGLSLEKLKGIRNSVTELLGSTKTVTSYDRKVFRKKIAKYADSHNKTGGVEAWPLVEFCEISHRWQLLAGGLVLVDLPGVQDANAARGKVAEKWMRRLDAVWIVADITRAVDDKTAKDLLGKTFRQRMVMDGRMRSITFICTKTDNIQASDTRRDLGRDEVCARSGTPPAEFAALEGRIKAVLREEKEAKAAKREAAKKVSSTRGQWTKACNEAKAIKAAILQTCRPGGTPEGLEALCRQAIPPPSGKDGGKKGGAGRKRGASGGDEEETEDADGSDSEEEEEQEEEAGSDSDGEEDGSQGGEESGTEEEEDEDASAEDDEDFEPSEEAASEEAASEEAGDDDASEASSDDGDSDGGRGKKRRRSCRKSTKRKRARVPAASARSFLGQGAQQLMATLRAAVDKVGSCRAEYPGLVRRQEAAERELAAVSQRLAAEQRKMTAICAVARNEFSRERLQQDFKEGLEEMLGHSGDRSRAAQYADLELPVFCVSARDAQKLEGRCKRDGKANAFIRLDQTELPKLRRHASGIAERGRVQAQARLVKDTFHFINSVGSTLLSKRLDSSATATTRDIFEVALQHLGKQLYGVQKQLVGALKVEFLDRGLTPRLTAGGRNAAALAPQTAREWGQMHYMTYRAAVNRGGDWVSGRREVRFNGQLVEPIYEDVADTWGYLFNSRLQQLLREAERRSLRALAVAIQAAREQLHEKLGGEPQQLEAVCAQVKSDEACRLEAEVDRITAHADEAAKALHQDVLVPSVRARMQPAYDEARKDSGRGVYARMRRLLERHVEEAGPDILLDAVDQLEQEVVTLLRELEDKMRSALKALLEGAAARFALLWEAAPASFGARRAAAEALHGLVGRAAELCRKAGVDVPEPFPLQQPEAAEASEELGQEGEDREEGPEADEMEEGSEGEEVGDDQDGESEEGGEMEEAEEGDSEDGENEEADEMEADDEVAQAEQQLEAEGAGPVAGASSRRVVTEPTPGSAREAVARCHHMQPVHGDGVVQHAAPGSQQPGVQATQGPHGA